MTIRMKYFTAALAMLLLPVSNLFSQVITTNPPFPTDADSVVVIFDATKGNGELANVAPPIYAHTGVITNLSSGPSAWRYVIADWSVNTSKALMTPLGNNLYQIVIKPSVRDFYGVPPSETILQMAFVFRNADGSKVGRNSDGSDIFANVYPPGVQVNITSPANGSIIELNEMLTIQATASEADSMFLFLNSTLLAAVAGKTISSEILADEPGSQWIKASAKYENEFYTDSVYFFARGEALVAELPSGVINGINYLNNNSVTLVLHDPPALKQYAFVIGDFNDWMVHEDYYMKRSPDGTFFWLTIQNLEAGKEYIYQYYIDGELRLADPYTHKVIDPWHDKWIPESTYPGLIQYPEGKTTGIASVLQTAQQPYDWEVTDFTPPAVEDLVIYELLIRDFIADRDIKTLIDTLDYLERLGVNAIELMPINEFEGNDSWGYNPSFYFATDKAYGRKQDYQRFIDECHKRGIAVIIDMVLNHSFGQSPLVQMYSKSNFWEPAPENPWYNEYCPHEPWCWGADFDHTSPYTKEFVDRVNAHWLTEFKVDGFRFDFTKGFTNHQTGNQGSNYDAARIAILKRMADKIWEVNPDAYVILEHFCENSEERELANYGMLIWGNMNYAYNEATMGWLTNSNFSGISYKNRGWSVPHLVGYMESHDEERLMFKNVTWGNSSNASHNVKDTTIALKRIETAAALFFTIPGPKMIWQFGELGYDYSINHCPDGSINDGCRTSAKPVRWDYTEDHRREAVFNVFAQLIRLKKNYDVFRTDDFSISLGGAIKRVNLNHAGMNAVVVGNFGLQAADATLQFQHTGWWYEYFSGDSLNVSDVNMAISLEPAEYRLYTTKNVVGIRENKPGSPARGNNLIISPIPAGKQISIGFEMDETGLVSLELFNFQGSRVAMIHEGIMNRGSHRFHWQRPPGLAPGFYMMRLQTGTNSFTEKLILQ